MYDLTIKVLGKLGTSIGGSLHRIRADKLSEGISYLKYQFPDFIAKVIEMSESGMQFSVIFQQDGGSNIQISDPQWLDIELTRSSTLIIAPVPVASGEFGKLLLGVGLVGAALFFPGSIGLFGLASPISTATLGLYGAGLVLGSVVNWLSPKPFEAKPSVIAGAISNNVQGSPIPIVYGTRFVSPQVISGGTVVENRSSTQHRSNGAFFGGWGEDYLAPRSVARLQVVDALCEGQIKGLVSTSSDADQGIWLNNTPLKNPDGGLNYAGVQNYEVRLGTQSQSALSAPFNRVLGQTTVGAPIRQDTGGVTRRVYRPNVNGIYIRLYWDVIGNFRADAAGDSSPVNASHSIYVKEGVAGSWQLRATDSFYGMSSSPFERDVFINLGSAEYYDIRVVRNRPDAYSIDYTDTTARTIRDVAAFKSYTIVINTQLRYPNTAVVALNINLEKFGATEISRIYHIYGKVISIPSNATVRADGSLYYTGLWDGIFVQRWCADPAWCLYDLITNSRYGCKVNAARLDKFAFANASAYCGQLIDDGFGGKEPRFTLNCELKTSQAAYTAIQQLCGVFNAIAYYQAGTLVPVIDRPLPITHQFTNSNATFRYSGTAWRNRRNRAVVTFDRADYPNQTDIEFHEDRADIARRGVEEVRFDAFGSNSRGQTRRGAKWAIYSEQEQTESVTISTGMDGALVSPGEIIQVGDRDRSGLRRWGRIVSATANTVTLDEPVSLPSGSYTITCILPDGTSETHDLISGGLMSVVSLATVFTTIPLPQATWLIAGTDLKPQLYRVISRAEPATYKFEILALQYEAGKFDFIETGLNFIQPPYTVTIPVPTLPIQNLITTPNTTSIDISWTPPTPSTYTVGYQLEWRQLQSGSTVHVVNLTTTNYTITGIGLGDYEISVRARDTAGNYSDWTVAIATIGANAYFTSDNPIVVPLVWLTDPHPEQAPLSASSIAVTTSIQPISFITSTVFRFKV